MNKSPKQELKDFITWLVQVAVLIAFCILFLVTALEWAVGCGETYTDSNGVEHLNECTFIDQSRSNHANRNK